MNHPVAEAKRRLRLELRDAVQRMPALEKAEAARRICARLPRQDVWAKARVILFYAPRPDEADIGPLFRLALAEGKKVAFPRFVPEIQQYGAAHIQSPDRDLVRGHFGILEPGPACREADLHGMDLALVPGLGFSPSGWRLGQGRGYFDRLLARAGGEWCGVAFDCQVALDVPWETHDIRLHYIVTPTRWLECRAAAP